MNKTILLKNLANYVEDKISADKLNKNNYIGVDNILPNRGGIKTSEYFYGKGKVTAFKKGDILIGNIRPYFKKIWLATFDGGCDTDVLCIRPKEEELSSFLYSTLSTDFFFNYVVKGAKGSKMPRGDKKHIMEFPIMDISNKKVIGDFIVAINEKIANNNAISKELESMAKTIYDYWFLQFEFPDKDGKPYKSNGGKMVWNDQLKQEIPEGWEVKKLEDLAQLGNGINYNKNISNGKVYKIVNVRDITSSSLLIDEQNLSKVTLPNKNINNFLVNSNDILIARSGTPGAVRILATTSEKVLFAGFIIHCLPNNPDFKWYLTYTLKGLEGTTATTTGGSILQNVSQTTLKSIPIVLPPTSLVRKFNNYTLTMILKLQNLLEESQQLQSLRDFLLPMLMNGQVIIED